MTRGLKSKNLPVFDMQRAASLWRLFSEAGRRDSIIFLKCTAIDPSAVATFSLFSDTSLLQSPSRLFADGSRKVMGLYALSTSAARDSHFHHIYTWLQKRCGYLSKTKRHCVLLRGCLLFKRYAEVALNLLKSLRRQERLLCCLEHHRAKIEAYCFLLLTRPTSAINKRDQLPR